MNPPPVPTGHIAWNWTKWWKHVQDGISHYIGLHKDDGGYHLHIIGNSTMDYPIHMKTYNSDIDVIFIKRFMIVVYSGGLDRYLWKDDEYTLIDIASEPKFIIRAVDDISIADNDDYGLNAEQILGHYKKRLIEKSHEGYFSGAIMFRAAFKMYDGSYIMHTIPYTAVMYRHTTEVKWFGESQGRIQFYMAKAQIKFNPDDYTALGTIKDTIQSVVLFACKPETLIEVSEDTITDEKLKEWNTGVYSTILNNIYEVQDAYKDMVKTGSWYRVEEYAISEILAGDFNEAEINLKDFYVDYATRETLPVDQFSHHQISGEIQYNYNSRLVLARTTQTLAGRNLVENYADWLAVWNIQAVSNDNQINFSRTEEFYDLLLLYKIDTADGEKIVQKYQQVYKWTTQGLLYNEAFLMQGVIGYPDSRAKEVDVCIWNGSEYKRMTTVTLESHPAMNFAYRINGAFNPEKVDWITSYWEGRSLHQNFRAQIFTVNWALINSHETINPNLTVSKDTVFDSNRIQISEISNPFVFPAKNSYQVGSGEIRDIAANVEPLSTGQFGEHPLQVFTANGVWAMIQGQGDILFSNVVPSSSMVMKKGSRLVSTGNAVIFRDEKGWIFALTGREVQRLSEPLDNPQSFTILDNPNLKYFAGYTQIVELSNCLDGIGLKSYMSTVNMGFDKENNELVISNYSYPYSWVLNFDSGSWYKLSHNYKLFVNNYPYLEGLDTTGLFRLSTETASLRVQVLFITREQSLGYNEVYKKLKRSLIRTICDVNPITDNRFGYYVFGSDDLYNWQLTAGSDRKSGLIKDVISSRSHKKWKYYSFMFAANVKTSALFSFIDVQFSLVANRKIR